MWDDLFPLVVIWLTVMDGLIVCYRPHSVRERRFRAGLFAATACSLLCMWSTISIPTMSGSAIVAVDLHLGMHLRLGYWYGVLLMKAWPVVVAISLTTATIGPVVYLWYRASSSKKL